MRAAILLIFAFVTIISAASLQKTEPATEPSITEHPAEPPTVPLPEPQTEIQLQPRPCYWGWFWFCG